MKDPVKREHEAWQKLCQQLLDIGAVSEQDLQSRVSATATPGQRLLRQIRKWGDLRADMFSERSTNRGSSP